MAREVPRQYRKHRSRHTAARGRVWLVAIFWVLRVCDALLYLRTPGNERRHLAAAIFIAAAWTTTLLAGLYFRNDWCHPVLILALGGSFLGFAYLTPGILQTPPDNRMLGTVASVACLYAAMVWALISQPDIHRLIGRHHR